MIFGHEGLPRSGKSYVRFCITSFLHCGRSGMSTCA